MLRICCVFIIILFSIMIFGTTFSLTYQQNILDNFYNSFQLEIWYKSNDFSFHTSLLFSNDGKFPPFLAPFYGNYYVVLTDSGIRFSADNLKFSFGNLSNYDVIDSPYSLYFSSLGYAKPTISMKYLDEKFEYETRYVLISYDDGGNFVNKGMNFKYYAIKVGNFRIGYEESVVYASRTYFDLEYFLNPVPNFFLQYVRESSFYKDGMFNDNSLMGFFIDYKDMEKYWYVQILIDDFNANRIFNPENPTVDKVAWSLGFKKLLRRDLKIGLYHAGATKYTFQPSGNSGNQLLYGYTYYNETIFGDYVIDYQENYIGYKYGENNLALLLNLLWTPGNFKLNSELEFIISGTKSPVNPWTERDSYEPGFNLLNEDSLEKTMLFKIGIEKDFGIITLGTKLLTGMIYNKLELVDAYDLVGKPYYAPSSNNERLIDLKIFLKIKFNF
ncbi:hypothetical protein [Thermosipho atlanticus]|uniref:Capsule assembly protein Wzi n=1 Tax=Thermosipho atlanticus DSM 15807 TaxID=1123380 RepID=A0A1M5U7T7_9BACT|nr:hypothetical protein [Thermosipho atlanticus]SHH58753.1 hypothetical protein SAMN02745199_1659 [Thermosipho atlanticus DSM 15807]